jgi:hypothetical protein
MKEYCLDEDAPKRPTAEGPSCEWEEYEQTGEYITKVDEIIQVDNSTNTIHDTRDTSKGITISSVIFHCTDKIHISTV